MYTKNVVPEKALIPVLETLISATSQGSDVRYTAVRWFNQLYYDVRKWNLGFIEFLQSYPGFKERPCEAEYNQFTNHLQNYYDSLSGSDVENELCSNLSILAQRFTKDFEWLLRKDSKSYYSILGAIGESHFIETTVIDVAKGLCLFIGELLGLWAKPDTSRLDEFRKEVKEQINKYRETSNHEIGKLHEIAQKVGISLMTISEYEAALLSNDLRNSNLTVIGEISVGDSYNISGQVGAIGPNAHAQDMTFSMIGNQIERSMDLVKLAGELAVLRWTMEKEATGVEHDTAVSNIAKAEQAARRTDSSKLAENLKSAGQWALDIAVKIGVPLAIEALKQAI